MRQRLIEPRQPLRMAIMKQPEPEQGAGEAQAHLSCRGVLRILDILSPGEVPGESGAQIVMLTLQEVEPAQRISAEKLPIGALRVSAQKVWDR